MFSSEANAVPAGAGEATTPNSGSAATRGGYDLDRLQAVIDAMPGLVSYVDTDLRYRLTNRRYAEWYGKPDLQLLGKTVAEVIGANLFELAKPYLNRALAGETVVYEFPHAYIADQQQHLRATYVPDQAGDGSVRGIVVLVEDFTREHEAEERQKEVERQLRLIIEASSRLLASPETRDVLQHVLDLAKEFIEADAYSVWRKSGTRTWEIAAMQGLSERFAVVLNDAAGEAEQLPLEPLVIEDVMQAPFRAERKPAYEQEGIRSLVAVPLRLHGEVAGTIVFYYFSHHQFSELQKSVAGSLGNLAAAALSTAELYEREKRLREQAEADERKAIFLARAGEILSSSLDYESTLVKVAELAVPAFADWVAVDIAEASGEVRRVITKHSDPAMLRLGEEFRRRFPPEDSDAGRVVLRTGESILVEEISDELLVQKAKSAEHAQALRELGVRSVILAPLVTASGSFGVLSFVTAESGRRYTRADLAMAEELARRAATAVENARLFTESKQAQEALNRSNLDLRRANEDLNQFAYSVSHDLQEPLRMIVVYSQLLERKYREELDGSGREYLNYIVDGARRMEMLLSDLLIYMHTVNFKPSALTPVNAAAAAEKALKNLASAIAESGAEVRHSGLPDLSVEEIHLVQLFQNLIGNAIKYRRDVQPQIVISAEQDGAEWKIRIQDNGIGIPREYMDQVFGLFKRLHSKSQYPGTGIGLAICQKIVERYGGRIWIESEEGIGSTVSFTLPGGQRNAIGTG